MIPRVDVIPFYALKKSQKGPDSQGNVIFYLYEFWDEILYPGKVVKNQLIYDSERNKRRLLTKYLLWKIPLNKKNITVNKEKNHG